MKLCTIIPEYVNIWVLLKIFINKKVFIFTILIIYLPSKEDRAERKNLS